LSTSIIPEVEEKFESLTLEMLQLINEKTHLPAGYRNPEDPIG
jgi:hypothetical protein